MFLMIFDCVLVFISICLMCLKNIYIHMFTLFKGMYPHIRVFKVLIYPCVLGFKGSI